MRSKGSTSYPQSKSKQYGGGKGPAAGAQSRLKSERVQKRLKSERVQLELRSGGRVRKILQRGAHGRFVEPLVLPAEQGVQVSVFVATAGPGEVLVMTSFLRGSGVVPEAGEVAEVSHAAA